MDDGRYQNDRYYLYTNATRDLVEALLLQRGFTPESPLFDCPVYLGLHRFCLETAGVSEEDVKHYRTNIADGTRNIQNLKTLISGSAKRTAEIRKITFNPVQRLQANVNIINDFRSLAEPLRENGLEAHLVYYNPQTGFETIN